MSQIFNPVHSCLWSTYRVIEFAKIAVRALVGNLDSNVLSCLKYVM